MKEKLIDLYIEFFNDFLSIDKFAEYHGITKEEAIELINIGRKYHIEKTDIQEYLTVYKK